MGIVQALAEMGIFDEIRILPVYQHTFSAKRNQLETFEHRMKLCRLAFEGITKAVVSNAEERSFQRMSKNVRSQRELEDLRVGTAELLEMLMEEEPNTDFSFCLGGDTFMDLATFKWRRSKDVLKLLGGRLVVLFRRGMSEDELRERVAEVNATDAMNNIRLLEIPALRQVSSSMVRLTSREEALSHMVSPAVLDYIRRNNLYAFNSDADT